VIGSADRGKPDNCPFKILDGFVFVLPDDAEKWRFDAG
jgi:hypothetical protein